MDLRGLQRSPLRWRDVSKTKVYAIHDAMSTRCYRFGELHGDMGDPVLMCSPNMQQWIDIGVHDVSAAEIDSVNVTIERRMSDFDAWRYVFRGDYLQSWLASEERCGEHAVDEAGGRLYVGSDMSDSAVVRVTVSFWWGTNHDSCRFYISGWGVECFDVIAND